MSFHADQSLSLFIYFLGKVFVIQFLSYINHTLLFLRNPIGKLTIEMITLLHSTNFFDRVETMYRISSNKTRGYYFFAEPTTAGIIRVRALFEGWYYY